MDKEFQAYYDARFDMMASKGWQDLIEDNLDEYFGKYAKQYKQYADSDQERWQIAHNIAHNNQQRSHRLLFKIMQEHIEGWWD